MQARVAEVIVATDDERIVDALRPFETRVRDDLAGAPERHRSHRRGGAAG